MENDHKCTIGLYFNEADADIVTWEELCGKVKADKDFLEWCKQEHFSAPFAPTFTLLDYTDFRKGTNLVRFKFCPYCGEKIDWKALREEAKHENGR